MKKSIRKKTLLYSHPVFIIGTYDKNDVPNIMAVSWGGICCTTPPCIGISLREATYTYWNIMENKAFTVNIPPEKYVKEADYVGVYSGKDENKFETTGLTPVKSELVNAPYVKEFPLSMICELRDTVKIGSHTQFIGEIQDVIAEEDILNERGYPMIDNVKPFIYDSSTRSYYKIGERLSDAFVDIKKEVL